MNERIALPVGDIIVETYKFLLNNSRDLLALIGLPVLVLSVLAVVINIFIVETPVPGQEAPGSFYFGQFIMIVASAVFYVMFAVAWHRRCLKPAEQTTIWAALRWDRRKSLFLSRFIAINLIVGIAALPVLLISTIMAGMVAGVSAVSGAAEGPELPFGLLAIVALATLLPAFMLNARLALWLPATALDKRLTLVEAWQAGDGRSWQLFAIFLLTMVPGFVLLIFVVSTLVSAGAALGIAGTLTFALVKGLAATFINYLTIAAGVSGLSFAYKRLHPPHQPGMPFFMNS